MKISELARVSGLPLATVKFYLREGLLPGGARTAPNQASYGQEHVRRLRLIRTLRAVGRLDIERIRRVVAAIDDDRLSRHEVFGVVEIARAADSVATVDTPGDMNARADVDHFIGELGWLVRPDAVARAELAGALSALRALGREYGTEVFAPYADAADRMAAWEVATIPASESRSMAVERMVVGTVVFGAVFDALRRLAHEHHSASFDRERAPDADPEHLIVWRYRVASAEQRAFERAYGPGGPWVALFATAHGYRGTELVRGVTAGDYLTVDRWESRERFAAFRSDRAVDYERLDASLDRLTESETLLFEGSPVGR